MLKLDFLDYPNLIEEAQKINNIAMNPNRTTSGEASWTNPRTLIAYSVAAGGEAALAKKIISDNSEIFGALDMAVDLNAKLTRVTGDTAGRPASSAAGDTYFDTTLGKPIWYSGTGWVDASGTAV